MRPIADMSDPQPKSDQTFLELARSRERGYTVLAKRDLAPGTALLREDPLVSAIPDSHWRFRCRHCLALIAVDRRSLEGNPVLCGVCRRACYCCPKCQESDFRHHFLSGECGLVGDQKRREELGVFVREACLALRLHSSGAGVKEDMKSNVAEILANSSLDSEDKDLFRSAARSMSQPTSIPEIMEREGLATVSCSYEEASTALGQVISCAIELMPAIPGQGEEVGWLHSGFREHPSGVYRWISKLNHSCRANCVYFCTGSGEACLRTVVDVKAGEEITIAYTDALDPGWLRRTSLRQRYCFDCECARCSDVSGGHDDWYLTAFRHGSGWVFRSIEKNDNGAESQAADWRYFEGVDVPHSGQGMHEIDRNLLGGCVDLERRVSEVVEQSTNAYLEGPNDFEAIQRLEDQILGAVSSGMHSFHHLCFSAYACLSPAFHVRATGKVLGGLKCSGVDLWKSALYGLVSVVGVECMVARGEHALINHAARHLCSLVKLVCECLAEQCFMAETDRKEHHSQKGMPDVLEKCTRDESEQGTSEVSSKNRSKVHPPPHRLYFAALLSLLNAVLLNLDDAGALCEDYMNLIPDMPLFAKCNRNLLSGKQDRAIEHLHGVLWRLGCQYQCDRLLVLGCATASLLARAQDVVNVLVGECHPSMESVSFLPLFSDLPYSVASALCQAACMLRVQPTE